MKILSVNTKKQFRTSSEKEEFISDTMHDYECGCITTTEYVKIKYPASFYLRDFNDNR